MGNYEHAAQHDAAQFRPANCRGRHSLHSPAALGILVLSAKATVQRISAAPTTTLEEIPAYASGQNAVAEQLLVTAPGSTNVLPDIVPQTAEIISATSPLFEP